MYIYVYERSRGRKNVEISFQVGPFFSCHPYIDTREPVRAQRRNAERPPGMGLSKTPGNVLHFISRRGSRSRIFIAYTAPVVRVSFLSRVPQFYNAEILQRAHRHIYIYIHTYSASSVSLRFLLPLFAHVNIEGRPIRRRISSACHLEK